MTATPVGAARPTDLAAMSFRPTSDRLWSSLPDLDALNQLHVGTLGEVTGMRFTEVKPDFLRLSIPVDARTKQPAGLLHGGASAALIETVGSVASNLIAAEHGKLAVGTELNCSHVRSANAGHVHGVCRAIRIGRTTHVWEVRVTDDRDRLVCIGRLSTMVVAP